MDELELRAPLVDLAREAGRLLAGFSVGNAADLGLGWKGANDPVTEADRSAHRLCLERLPRILPGVPLISEEGDEETDADLFWSLDPLDGTSEFVENLGEWAFQLALVRSGRPVAAVLALPAVDRLYYAEEGKGCLAGRLSGQELSPFLPVDPLRRERLILTRSLPRRPSLLRIARSHPGGDELLLGGVGYKVHALLSGEGDTYFTVPGTLHPWDLAAPLLVARESGLACRTLAGEVPTVPNNRDSVPEGQLFTRPRWLERNLEFFARKDIRELVTARDPR
jgi:3'-phosphoadenosine 5'-phosphosulfate (PAPS) 3'-phosphatase